MIYLITIHARRGDVYGAIKRHVTPEELAKLVEAIGPGDTITVTDTITPATAEEIVNFLKGI